MATNFPHEDVPQLGHEKSEEIYKDWEKYWMAVQTTKVDGILSVTQGQSINWNLTGNGDVNAKIARDKQDRRWIFGLRHGERVDLTYGKWTEHCFGDNDTYIRKDLNMPLSLPPRVGGKDAFYKDTPLTRMGRFQAYLVGEGLRLAGVSVRHVYASAALRCVETADSFLEGLQAGPSVKVKVEPGLFEYKVWHASKGIAPFMTPKELYKAGYNVDPDYKPYVDLDINSTETLDEFYMRNEKIMQTVVNETEAEGGNIVFVGHASTLDMMATSLIRHGEGNPEAHSYQVSKNLLRVPYCALGAMRDKPWEIVSPPCPPSINSSSGRFDWRILKN